ncbi:ATP-grasp domain-containing protein [Sphingomonas cavernae]|uniref:Transporter n=1 Tax=Sphingomonas cavernae TaxID=2320861 RepID=A0A418WLD4_9SPHN|nr:hypothetical protein [Sphingomonas cavernae]RJF90772.1 hypothetical protein D3876_11295 [Sphingomonas cavernae]
MTRAPRICILAPDPADPHFGTTWRPQADLLEAPLVNAGLTVDFRPWTAPGDLSGHDLVLPLLVWGYHARAAEWSAFLDGAAALQLANPPEVLRRNTDKRYLLDLAARGAPVVPTLAFDAFSRADIAQAETHFGTARLIAKPPVSAGAHGTYRLDAVSDPALAWDRAMLVQPMMPAIAQEGEWSLFYFDGRYSHAILKTVADGDFRVQVQHGGSARAATPPEAAIAAADAVLGMIEEPLLYARVDLIADGQGNYLLMELELIEPQLFLEHAPDDGRIFAEAVAAAI